VNDPAEEEGRGERTIVTSFNQTSTYPGTRNPIRIHGTIAILRENANYTLLEIGRGLEIRANLLQGLATFWILVGRLYRDWGRKKMGW